MITPAEPVTAVLSRAAMMEGLSGRFLVGDVFYDRHARWPNGYRIHTSYVLEEIAPDTFKTRSGHVYFVDGWAPTTVKETGV